MSVWDVDFGPEHGGLDWSRQRRIATTAIHALGCLGWEEIEGGRVHLCRSRAGNVLAALHSEGQLVPDDFRKPLTPARSSHKTGSETDG